jgi:thiol-disulfide isomerase/thioredoxin
MPRHNTLRVIAAVLCVAIGAWLPGCSGLSKDAAPDFEFQSFDGRAGTLHKQFGQPLVVNFWAVWCGPCQAEFPDFQKVYTAKKGQFRLLSVCVDREMDPPGFVRQQGYDWEFVYDGEGDKAGGSVFQISAIPRTLFINKRGELVDEHTGMMDQKQFEEKLAKIL